MECRCHDSSLPDDDGIVAFGGENLDIFSNALNFGRTNEDHFHWGIGQLPFPDRTVNLPSVGVAANADVDRA